MQVKDNELRKSSPKHPWWKAGNLKWNILNDIINTYICTCIGKHIHAMHVHTYIQYTYNTYVRTYVPTYVRTVET